MANIDKIQPMGISTQYDLTAQKVKQTAISSLSSFTDTNALMVTAAGGSNSVADKPSSVDAFGCFTYKTADGWYGQLLTSSNSATGLYWRTGTTLSGGWKKVLDSNNYNDYTPTKTGGGASGTWGISITGNAATATALTSNAGSSTVPIYFSGGKPVQCSTTLGVSITGNAATATKATQDGSGNTITSKYVTVDTAQSISGVKTFSAQQKLAGGFITGAQATSNSGSGVNIGTDGGIEIFHNTTPFIDFHYQYATKDYSVRLICEGDGVLKCTGKLYGAVWNDYAEYRETKESIEPGRCIVETGNGDLILSTERLQEGCEIVSDTFGFAIGQNEKNNTPTVASGRVLTYLYENKGQARPGQPVCSGPNGTVSLMTNEEAREWPWCIIGTISEIPNYDIWYAGNNKNHPVKVDGRIWIKVR